jgi:hypothetical protein
MNQRADSWKENFLQTTTNPLINRPDWLLSHIMRCNRDENPMEHTL